MLAFLVLTLTLGQAADKQGERPAPGPLELARDEARLARQHAACLRESAARIERLLASAPRANWAQLKTLHRALNVARGQLALCGRLLSEVNAPSGATPALRDPFIDRERELTGVTPPKR